MRQDRPSDRKVARLLDFKRPLAPVPASAAPATGPDQLATLLYVAAGRWDYVKLAPVLSALDGRAAFRQVLVAVGASEAPPELGLPAAEHRLEIAEGSHAERTAATLIGFERVLRDEAPVAVVIVGDTDAALAAALASAKAAIPVARIEAGLRSGDWSTPDEVNRVVTDRLADTLFTHSPEGPENLTADGIGEHQIHEVGSTLIDVLRQHERAGRSAAAWRRAGVSEGEYVLVLLERHEHIGRAERLGEIAQALLTLAGQTPIVMPLAPSTRALLGPTLAALEAAGVHCIEPLSYVDWLSLLSGAGAIVTDSGEAQEQAAALGVSCFALGGATERPVTIARGTNVLLGADAASIAEVRPSAFPPTPCVVPQWDGNTGARIADALVTQYALMSAFALGAR